MMVYKKSTRLDGINTEFLKSASGKMKKQLLEFYNQC